jgi:hypothetical protein
MNGALWILGGLFGFAILVQLLAFIYRSRRTLVSLQKELRACTPIMLDYRRKAEWLESRLEDLLDAARLQSCDVDHKQERLDRLICTIKAEAEQNGYLLGFGDID